MKSKTAGRKYDHEYNERAMTFR